MAVNASIITRNTAELAEKTGNIYESVVVMSKRAKQVSGKMKEELAGKLADFASSIDNLEEIFENKEQIEISKYYERQPKPSLVALEEFSENKLSYHTPSEE